MATQIQIRRDTAANWSASNPILAQGEIGLDLTVNNIKIGNALSTWNALSYPFTTNTAFSSYQTSVAASTATLLPTSVYRSASGSFATNTALNAVSGLLTPLTTTNTLTGLLTPLTTTNTLTGLLTPLTTTNTLTGLLLPTSIYQGASGSFATNTALNAASGLLTPLTTTNTLTGLLTPLTTTNTLTGLLLPTSIYQGASGSWQAAADLLTTVPITTSFYVPGYSLTQTTGTPSNLKVFTVPAGRRFIAKMLLGAMATATLTGVATAPTLRLVNVTQSNTNMIGSWTPATTTLVTSPVPGAHTTTNANSIIAQAGEDVALRLITAAGGFSVLTVDVVVDGYLI